jgi:hypothetical protein
LEVGQGERLGQVGIEQSLLGGGEPLDIASCCSQVPRLPGGHGSQFSVGCSSGSFDIARREGLALPQCQHAVLDARRAEIRHVAVSALLGPSEAEEVLVDRLFADECGVSTARRVAG